MKTPQCTYMESPKKDFLLMSQTTHIKLETKDCVFPVSSVGFVKFTYQLFSMVSSPTRLGRLARPTVTSANHHQTKYEVKNPKLGSISMNGQLQSSCPCLVDVSNHIDQTRTKVLYITCKLSRYSVYTSTVFNGVVSNKVRQTSAPNSYNYKSSPEKIENQHSVVVAIPPVPSSIRRHLCRCL